MSRRRLTRTIQPSAGVSLDATNPLVVLGGIKGLWSGVNQGFNSATGINGVLTNGATTTPTDKGVAFSFDGVDDYVSLGTDRRLESATTKIVAFARVRRTAALADFSGILNSGKNASAQAGWMLVGISTNALRFYISLDGASGWLSATTAVTNINQWYDVCGTWDGVNIRVYLDGVLQATTACSAIVYPATVTEPASIGKYGTTEWPGQIALAAYGDGYWAADNVKRATDNPWQLFRPITRRIIVSAAALSSLFADTDQRWSLLNAAQADTTNQWSLLNAAFSDSDQRWSLLQALQADSALQWSVLHAILADTDQRWSVLAGVFSDSDLRWDLQSALSAVFQDVDLRHSVLSAVLNDADLRHSILNAVNADTDQRWSIVNAAQADGTYQWSMVAAIQNDSSLIWDLQSALTAVFQDSTLQWSLIAAIQQQLDAQWSLLNSVQIDADARWSIANAVAQDLTAQWSALGAAYKDATIQWSSLAVGETSTTLSWTIQSEVVPPKIISIVFSTKTRSIVFSAKPN